MCVCVYSAHHLDYLLPSFPMEAGDDGEGGGVEECVCVRVIGEKDGLFVGFDFCVCVCVYVCVYVSE